MNKNNNKYASFCNGDRLAAFLYEHGDKFTIDECFKVVDDYFAGKEDWMPVVDE